MTTFWLWNVGLEGDRLTFFATAGNVPEIERGTSSMIAQMLRDLRKAAMLVPALEDSGVADVAFEQGSVTRYFRSDWHAQFEDDDPQQTWEDVWMATWELEVKLADPTLVAVALVERSESAQTNATDDTWDGRERGLPCDALIVADFDDDAHLAEGLREPPSPGSHREQRRSHPHRLFVWLEAVDEPGFETRAAVEAERWRALGAKTRCLDM